MFWRKRRLVRLHLHKDAPSIEGIFVGFWAGHYVLRTSAVWEAADRSSNAGDVRVPRENVVFLQEISA